MRGPSTLLASCAAACALALMPAVVFAADASPTPAQIEFAAHEHDLGYRAYTAKQYDEAATHFENAYFAAPNPAELRSAIRARRDAGELARAASLAAIGQRKYPDDAQLAKLADETIGAAKPKVFEVHITSPEECNVAVDQKAVAAEKVRDFRFFVDPGKHDLLIGWSDDRTKHVAIDAAAGGVQNLNLTPPPIPPKPVARSGATEGPLPSRKPFGPIVFIVGAGLTAVGAGLTIWSGIDTENHPGTAAVKADCVGQGTSCPEYQQGVSNQLRTNILLAATGGVAAVTAVVGIFFTQWSHPAPRAEGSESAAGLHLEPVLGPGAAGLRGTF
ncbi:MAG TPA: hypothetical protein VMI75_00630 [Polyangiaceae bacterium]|nr:hypothetical protein [Polyangiaceae bacterium]